MIEKMKICLDSKGIAGALLTDLSKAVDCLTYDLLIAKLNIYGFSYSELKLIFSYLTNRNQRNRIDVTISNLENVKIGVPLGSIMGSLLFNIFINDIFLFLKYAGLTNYADDNTPFVCSNSLEVTKASVLIQWFDNNLFKVNAGKSHVRMTTTHNDIYVQIGDANISCTTEGILLGITTDNKLTFDSVCLCVCVCVCVCVVCVCVLCCVVLCCVVLCCVVLCCVVLCCVVLFLFDWLYVGVGACGWFLAERCKGRK